MLKINKKTGRKYKPNPLWIFRQNLDAKKLSNPKSRCRGKISMAATWVWKKS